MQTSESDHESPANSIPSKLEAGLPRKGAIGVFLLDFGTPLAYVKSMAGKLITVAETPLFVRQAKAVWDEDERLEFVSFIAANPDAGDVIPET